jgi:hypothetical protein
MKRKVKFQVGGEVEGPPPRNQQLRDAMDEARRTEQGRQRAMSQDAVRQFNQMPEVQSANERTTRNRTRIGLAERAYQRELARQAAIREQAVSRAASQAEVARFNDRMNRAVPVTPDQARALGAEPPPRPANPRPFVAARDRVLTPPPTTGAARGRVGTGLAGVANTAMALGPVLEEGLRERATRTMDERARTSRLDGMRRSLPAGPDAEVERLMRDMPAGPDIEAERAASRPARAAPPQRRSAPMARREMTADQLNEMVLQRLGREPFETVPETPEATGPEAAVARERIRQRMAGGMPNDPDFEPLVARPALRESVRAAANRMPRDLEMEARMAQPYKKGGMVKPKAPVKKAAGGMIAPKVAAPMGRGKGRPAATAVKPFGTRAMAKAAGPKKPVAMPAFKKGGTVKKAKGGMIGRGCK